MLKTDLKGLLSDARDIGAYTPLFEAIVNSIQAIEEAKEKNGNIVIKTIRQPILLKGSALAEIEGFIIEDNGIGFNEGNLDAFQTAHTQKKVLIGGKGFGRFSFLKIFQNVEIESIFKQGGKQKGVKFNFSVLDNGMSDPEELVVRNDEPIKTTVRLLNKEANKEFDKHIKVIARKIVEHFLLYFSQNNIYFPEIVIQDEKEGRMSLNTFLSNSEDIISISEDKFQCKKENDKYDFYIKIFKVFYSEDSNLINLCADNRVVEKTLVSKYIPEFQKHFTESRDKKNVKGEVKDDNYVIKAYILGKYLDDNISSDRKGFHFEKQSENLFTKLSQEDIEKQAASHLNKKFGKIIKERLADKIKRINDHIDRKEPWYKVIRDKMDFSKIPEDISDIDLSMELHRQKNVLEIRAKKTAQEIIDSDSLQNKEKVAQLLDTITELGKADLIQYVASRKVILDIFEKSLQVDKKGKYELEDVVHDIIFPRKKDSESVVYSDHNLWLLDERLNFHYYLTSDQPLEGTGPRPDILIFDKAIVMREGNEATNPVMIFEFKRPQKSTYKKDPGPDKRTDDPIKQIADYAEDIRANKITTPEGRDIKVNREYTPFYGFIVCDLTDKARELFSRDYSLVPRPDNEGYFGFHQGYKIYFEVMSFDKMLRDANLRNRIFFNKLGIL